MTVSGRKRKGKDVDDKSTVRGYAHFEELRDCLASGWTATAAIDYLAKRYGADDIPHQKAIERWRTKHLDDSKRVIPTPIVKKMLKGVAFKVDVIAHLSRLVAICEERVGRGLQAEDQFQGMPLEVNDSVIRTYLDAMREYVSVAQDLGIMPSRPPAPLVDMRNQNLNISPETIQALRETVQEIRQIGNKEGQSV